MWWQHSQWVHRVYNERSGIKETIGRDGMCNGQRVWFGLLMETHLSPANSNGNRCKLLHRGFKLDIIWKRTNSGFKLYNYWENMRYDHHRNLCSGKWWVIRTVNAHEIWSYGALKERVANHGELPCKDFEFQRSGDHENVYRVQWTRSSPCFSVSVFYRSFWHDTIVREGVLMLTGQLNVHWIAPGWISQNYLIFIDREQIQHQTRGRAHRSGWSHHRRGTVRQGFGQKDNSRSVVLLDTVRNAFGSTRVCTVDIAESGIMRECPLISKGQCSWDMVQNSRGSENMREHVEVQNFRVSAIMRIHNVKSKT